MASSAIAQGWKGLLLAIGLGACGVPGTRPPAPNWASPYRVVLVTLDGVRWQEFYQGADPLLTPHGGRSLFPRFWSQIAQRGQVFGNLEEGSVMVSGSWANASLPSYTSLFAEEPQGCLTNACGRISVPTFLDRLHDEVSLSIESVAVFASWGMLRNAVTGREDVALIHAAGFDFRNESSHPERALLDDNLEMDRGPVMEAFDYFDRHRPRFLYLSLLDSDRYGHFNQYNRYQAVLESYDRLLAELLARIDRSPDAALTALIVTTDHGRGLWEQWVAHGPHIPSSGNIWAFGMLPPAAKEWKWADPADRIFNHHDVRYTVETLFGLGTRGPEGSTGLIEPRESSP